MNKKDIFIAVLAGGKGERLWPKSRISLPKQNLRLLGRRTIVQYTIERAKKIAPDNIFVIANKESFTNIRTQLKKFRIKKIVAEPFGRNTAPAIGLATLLAFRKNNNSILVAMPSDHIIGDNKKFFGTIRTAIEEADKEEAIITLGIKPVSAESAYGYIGIKEKQSQASSKYSYRVIKFIEKPKPAIARRLVSSGRFFWNSGVFIFKTSTMLSMLKEYMPALYRGLLMLPDIKDERRFNREVKRLYERLKSVSLDYAILEKSRNIRMVPSDFKWSDIGSFNSLARLVKKDKNGNTIFGDHAGIDTGRSVIFTDPNYLIGTIGIKDLIVVATSDAVLVCKKERADDIKKLVEKIKKNKKLLRFL